MKLENKFKIDKRVVEQYWKEEVLLRVLFFAAIGIIMAQTLDIKFLISLLFHSMIPLTAALWLCSITRKGIYKLDCFIVGIIVIAGVNVVINVIMAGGSFGFSYIKKYIFFSVALLFVQTAYKIRPTLEQVRCLYEGVDILTIWFIGMFIIQGKNRNLINGIVSNYLTFRFDNPNLVAMFLLCLFMFQTIRLFKDKGKERIIHIAYAGILAFFIFKTESRNCELVMAAYLLTYGWLWFTKQKKLYVPKIVAIGVSIFPAIFFGLYMLLINSNFIQKVFGFLVGIGKELDSRVKIWQPGWDGFKSSPIFGAYYQISDGTGSGQMHNTHLDIGAAYGIFVLILVCVYVFTILYQNGRTYKEKQTFCYIIGWAAVLTIGMGEAALYNGGLGIYLFMGSFLLLANVDRDRRRK